MTQTLTAAQLQAINNMIADRRDVFYWQTDRDLSPQQAGLIWSDRHAPFTDDMIVAAANAVLQDDQVVSVVPFNPSAQTNLGSINSVRVGKLASGQDIIIRCHPRGIRNGYFYVEALASQLARDAGLPAYRTLAIHDPRAGDDNDFAFQIIEKLPGTAVQKWLEAHPADEPKILLEMGKSLAKLHRITADGFGPFDNELAKKESKLRGLHATFADAVRAGLAFNLKELTARGILTADQAAAIDKLLTADNPLLACKQGVLVHNDFADWNMLTVDGNQISGMLDWDECVSGDPVADIACWSTFFPPERLGGMLKGYWQAAEKPADFEEKFELLRLRYTVSKMTLRVRRYEWDKHNEGLRNKIEIGKVHLAASLKHFNIT